jgi:hypothetical protein
VQEFAQKLISYLVDAIKKNNFYELRTILQDFMGEKI